MRGLASAAVALLVATGPASELAPHQGKACLRRLNNGCIFVRALLAAPKPGLESAKSNTASESREFTRRAQQPGTTPPLVPLAYVRRLILLPTALATAPDAPLPPAPPLPNKKALSIYAARVESRRQLVQARAMSLGRLDEALTSKLSRLPGLTLVQSAETPAEAGASGKGRAPAPPDMERLVEAGDADGALAVSVDRFGIRSGLERQVWLRLTAYLAPNKAYGGLRGPFYAYGVGRATRRLIGKGYQKNDERLVSDAAGEAAGQLAHTLATGEQAPFTRAQNVVIVPAVVPAVYMKLTGENSTVWTVPLPSLARQSEVLLQPEIGPVAVMRDLDDVAAAMKALGLQPEDLFDARGRPDAAKVTAVATRLKAAYVFVSRLTEVTVSDSAIEVKDDGRPRQGIERRGEAEAEAYLLRGVDAQVLWSDRAEGITIARTEYARHRPKLRTDEQCALDAARTAYAYLRSNLELYKQKFER